MRKASSPVDLEAMDANLVGGDISGGAMTIRQFLFRPSMSNYATGTRGIYLCSSSSRARGGRQGIFVVLVAAAAGGGGEGDGRRERGATGAQADALSEDDRREPKRG